MLGTYSVKTTGQHLECSVADTATHVLSTVYASKEISFRQIT